MILVPLPLQAQEICGTPGAPSATTTVDGNYLPNPPAKFGGVINLSAKNSKPYWPPNVVCRSSRLSGRRLVAIGGLRFHEA